MQARLSVSLRRLAALSLLALPALAACVGPDGDDGVTPTPITDAQVVLNSVDNSLTVFPEGAAAYTIGLGPQGSPVSMAVRNQYVVVPLGNYPFAAVVDLSLGRVAHTVALPANSGATGVDFLNDSIAVVANSNLNTVTPVNVRRGTAGAQAPVGDYPQAVVRIGAQLFVLNAELDENFFPAKNGTITVLNGALQFVKTIQLSAKNPTAAALFGTTVYVLNAGTFGGNNGSLSAVPAALLEERAVFTGFGEFPGSIALAPSGNFHVAVYGKGVLVWNPTLELFVRDLENPVVPGGSLPVSAVAFDPEGWMHTLHPGTCQAPGQDVRSSPSSGSVQEQLNTGVCPFATGFTTFAATPAS